MKRKKFFRAENLIPLIVCFIWFWILNVIGEEKQSEFSKIKIPTRVVVTNDFYLQPYGLTGEPISCTNGMELTLIEFYMLECMPGYDWIFATFDGRVGWYNSDRLLNCRIVE
jgi:hypothetical protein